MARFLNNRSLPCAFVLFGTPLVEGASDNKLVDDLDFIVKYGMRGIEKPSHGLGAEYWDHCKYYGGQYLHPDHCNPYWIMGDNRAHWVCFGPFFTEKDSTKSVCMKRYKGELNLVHRYLWEEMGVVTRVNVFFRNTEVRATRVAQKPSIPRLFEKRVKDGFYLLVGTRFGEYWHPTYEKASRLATRYSITPVDEHNQTDQGREMVSAVLSFEDNGIWSHQMPLIPTQVMGGHEGSWVAVGPISREAEEEGGYTNKEFLRLLCAFMEKNLKKKLFCLWIFSKNGLPQLHSWESNLAETTWEEKYECNFLQVSSGHMNGLLEKRREENTSATYLGDYAYFKYKKVVK